MSARDEFEKWDKTLVFVPEDHEIFTAGYQAGLEAAESCDKVHQDGRHMLDANMCFIASDCAKAIRKLKE